MTKSNDELKGMPSEIYAFKMIGDLGNCWQDYGCGDYAADSVGAKYVRADLAPTSQWLDKKAAMADAAMVCKLTDALNKIKQEAMGVEAMKSPARALGSILFIVGDALKAPPKDLADAEGEKS